jgi:hypothetical protein
MNERGMIHWHAETKLSVALVLSVAVGGTGCSRAAPIEASSAPAPANSGLGTRAVAAPAPSEAGALASPTSSPADVGSPAAAAAPPDTMRLYRRWPATEPLAKDEVPFASGPFPAPGVGEAIWVLGRTGPIGKGRVVRWISNAHDGNLCGGPSTVFILSMEPKPSDPEALAFHPVGTWSAPPKARGYDHSPPGGPEGSTGRFDYGADLDGDGVVDLAQRSAQGACQGLPAARKLPFEPTAEGCDGEYCSELWSRDASGRFQVTERVSHGFRSLGY